MGIYIKSMEMPEKIEPGLVIEFAEGIDGKRYARLHHYRYGGLTDWLEAFPVPKHGDLIERDAAYDKIAEQEGGNYVDMDAVDMGLNETPTIIPAEEGK